MQENYENDSNVVLDNTAINQTVYIYGCKNSTIQVKGKVNTVTVGECNENCISTITASCRIIIAKY